ncbi:NADH dehydrogenase [ubiquinone] 1 alpha subcomplex subunit 11 [Austrofundulus limnaeus]|uniref:NADH dehydrogenase [ubiquinone] 1 alpha subcomplex subunit 11 n=1 Tax=Austrofundulus limnaeus TaxID=52670 RepID=A0A2I4BYR5_AUSLI|nr:PREDICTED: NADH dehydrogenase [ubiquinone] 1 alpha subcomplex subunit 11 [Austrofundulus limnaeus]
MGYWDVPQGTDCVEKTWTTTKLGTALGLVGSAYYSLSVPPEPALSTLTRSLGATVLMASVGAVFGVTTCLSASIRDAPEDPFNFFIGGCASGVLLGARSQSAAVGTTACLGLGAVAYLVKAGRAEGWRFSGPPEV